MPFYLVNRMYKIGDWKNTILSKSQNSCMHEHFKPSNKVYVYHRKCCITSYCIYLILTRKCCIKSSFVFPFLYTMNNTVCHIC